MPDKQIDLDLKTDSSRREVAELRRELEATEAVARSLAGLLNAGHGDMNTRQELGSAISRSAQLRGALANVSQSAAAGPAAASAAMAGASSAAAMFLAPQIRTVSDPAGVMAAAQQAGVPPSALHQIMDLGTGRMALNPATASASSVIQSALQSASLNPFAGASPMGPASAIGQAGIGLMQFQYQQAQQQNLLRQGLIGYAGREVVGWASSMMGAYASSITSGSQNVGQFAGLYGQVVGAGAGAMVGGSLAGGALASTALGGMIGSIFPGVGTATGMLVGAMAGGVLGGSAAQLAIAPAQRTLQGYQTLAPYNAAMGYSVMSGGLASSLGSMSGDINTRFHQAGGGILEGIGRFLHLYTGMDVTSEQDIAQVMSSLGGSAMSAGLNLSVGALKFQSRRLIEQYGQAAPEIAKTFAQAQGNINLAGNNVLDLMQMTGVTPTMTYLQQQGRMREATSLLGGIAGLQLSQYAATGAQSVMEAARADYSASAYSPLATRDRTSLFNAQQSAMQGAVSALDNEIARASAMPGGADSNYVKGKKALRAQMLTEIASEASQRAQGLVGDIQSESAVRLGTDRIALTSATLYGNASSFAPVGARMSSDLGRESNELRAQLNNPNLPYAQRQSVLQRLRDIDVERLSLPAQMAGLEMRRSLLSPSVAVNAANLTYQTAALYGSDRAVQAGAASEMQAHASVGAAAMNALNNPALSVEDRAAAAQAYLSAGSSMLAVRANTAATMLSRVSGRASVAQGAAGVALSSALLYGSDASIAQGAGQLSLSLTNEASQLQAMLQGGNLTVEQSLGAQNRLNAIASQQLQLGASTNEALIGRMNTRATTSITSASTALNIASLTGRAPQMIAAAQGLQGQYSAYATAIASQLARPDLTFEQRNSLLQQQSQLKEQQVSLAVSTREDLFHRQDITNFGLPSLAVQTALQVRQYMPYQPGNMLALAGQDISINRAQIGRLQGRLNYLQSSGQLTEDEEYSIHQQMSALQVQSARDVAMLSDQRESLLPGMLAGRRRVVGAADSLQLAALSFARAGSYVRSYGSVNGRDMMRQNSLWDSYGITADIAGPTSRTSNINAGLSMSSRGVDMSETNGILRDIASLLRSLGSGPAQGSRTSPNWNSRTGQPSGNNPAQGNTTINRGN